jgi:fructose-specific PTS system IIC-like component
LAVKISSEEREAGKAALVMGCVGVTEGAIPFAASDPLRVIPPL